MLSVPLTGTGRHLQFLLPPFDIRDFHDALFEITGQALVE